MKVRLFFSFLFFWLSSLFGVAQTAEEIMSSVRQVAVLQGEQTLNGRIRKGSSREIPLSLFMRGKDIQFALNGGSERFHLRLNENDQQLFEITDGKTREFPSSKISRSIGGTDASYEDLALKFLYWKNPRIVAQQKLGGKDCWRLHVENPDESGRYREISVWVTKRERALMRVVGYGPRPEAMPVKQFEITDVMKVNDVFTVKKMKILRFNKERRVEGITFLEFDKPAG